MNLESALLVKRVLDLLTGSAGKKPSQLANECRINLSCANRLLMCIEKAGLVTIQDNGYVALADSMAERVTNHVLTVPGETALSHEWSSMRKAVLAHEAACNEALRSTFNALFWGAK